MSTALGKGRWDERVWSVATRSGPIVIQFVLGAVLISGWLLGKTSFVHHDNRAGERVSLLIATAIAFGISLVVAGALFSRDSSRSRGIGLSVAASAVIVLIGGVSIAYLLF